jgi:DNA polymerase I-like protein with 3'-5' exonuclease and polymerase domains
MSDETEQQKAEETLAPRKPSKKRLFRLSDGTLVTQSQLKILPKMDKDMLIYYYGEEKSITPPTGKKKEKIEWITPYDQNPPMLPKAPVPSAESPLCKQCDLFNHECRTPFMPFGGSKKPLITIIFDGVTHPDDMAGALGIAGDGSPAVLRQIIRKHQATTGVTLDDVRWVTMTRCSNWLKKMVDLKPRANWCRYHAIDDLMRYPPALIMPVGTVALGMLSHKSNAEEWSGRLLTFRGWPDDWLTNPKYALSYKLPNNVDAIGHPLFGPIPDWRIPMVPIQSPRIINARQNRSVRARWEKQIVAALKMAKQGVPAPKYTRKWYHWTEDPAEVSAVLGELLEQIEALKANGKKLAICYDTETTGVRPWAKDAAIVSIMLRWTDPFTNKPRSIGFPWDFGPTQDFPEWRESPLRPYLHVLKLDVWKVLTQSTLIGHNLTFDMLYTYATFWKTKLVGWDDPQYNRKRDSWLVKLANACKYDTWHMAFAIQQRRGSLGLEVLAYEWVPDLAGYEEDMTLLIDLHRESMHPAEGKGGHYLNCPVDKTETHLIPYVMGDVEVCYQAREKIAEKLATSRLYEIPLADPKRPGKFRWYAPHNREWVYEKIMSPAASVLMKMMARGLYIDKATLHMMEDTMPKRIKELRTSMANVDPRIASWIKEKAATEKGFELDLENKSQLKDLIFNVLKLPVKRFTKQGRKLLGENIDEATASLTATIASMRPELNHDEAALNAAVQEQLREVAAVDKFTLNNLCSEHEQLRPLMNYRKEFKLYSTYVRPLQNYFSEGLDKKQRTADAHLCFDSCIHASFLLTGTRGGRLSCKDPNLQQLPRDGAVKSMFVSRFGKRGCMYQGDLSQIELRLMAAACGDPTMVKAYFDDIDLHSLTTSRIFDVPYEHFSKDYMKSLQEKGNSKEAKELDEKRSIGKTVNFLTGYGGGAFGLQNVLAMKGIFRSPEECQHIIELFFDSYPSLKTLLMEYKRFIMDNHVACSVFGRVRVFEEVLGEDKEAQAKALRAGCNHLIQSTASDMMLTALCVIEDLMRQMNLESILVSTVHDSLVIDAVREELPIVHEIVTDVLNNFPDVFKHVFGNNFDTSWMLVPFSGDCEVGLNYLNMKKIPKKDIDWDKLLIIDK